MDRLIEDTATRIFSGLRHDPQALWSALEDNGLTRLWAKEADGGFGLEPIDGFGMISLVGRHAAQVPIAETLAAVWLLTQAGLRAPGGRMSLLVDGHQRAIPFGSSARHIVKVSGTSIALLRGPAEAPEALAGDDPMLSVSAIGKHVVAEGVTSGTDGLHLAALVRSAQICGALEATVELTIAFSEQRVQFGRSLNRFQAIQHLLSEMGAETAAARAAVNTAVATVRPHCPMDEAAVAIAKHRASLASGVVAAHAHQIHGAIGYTQEYGLARYTRRLWRWRDEFGSETYWAIALGNAALGQGGALWPWLSGMGMTDDTGNL